MFIKVNFNIDYFSIYMHLFGGNLPGVALKLTELVWTGPVPSEMTQ